MFETTDYLVFGSTISSENGVGNRKQTLLLNVRVCIETKPYKDLNTLIEQSASLNYSNRTFIASRGNSILSVRLEY